MKSCIITQVRDGFEYIPAFIAHHLELVDDIFIIDHISHKDLRCLTSNSVHVSRINIIDYEQKHYINYIMNTRNIKRKYKTIFILDIDEFLPFFTRDEINLFSVKHMNDDVVSFNWSNGFPKKPGSLNHDSQIYFCRRTTPTVKLCYNTSKNRRFRPNSGNHSAKYPISDIVPIEARPRIIDSGLGLLHIPFLSSTTIVQKMKENVSDVFRTKIEKYAARADENITQIEEQFDDNPSMYMKFIANYRTVGEDNIFDVNISDFDLTQPFADKRDVIEEWQRRVDDLPVVDDPERRAAESGVLRNLNTKSIGYLRRLRSIFREDSARCIMLSEV